MYKVVINYNPIQNELNKESILSQTIVNQDTISLIKEFVRLFIIEKTEQIVLKYINRIIRGEDTVVVSSYRDYTTVDISVYSKGLDRYKEIISMNPYREYNPMFLQLCDLLLGIARKNEDCIKKERK